MTTEPMTHAAGDGVRAKPYVWMFPARWLDRLRPGIGTAVAADTRRLRELPGWLGTAALPVAAVGLPLLLSIARALRGDWMIYADPDPWTVLVWLTFTESITFIAVVAVLGLAAPAAGVLTVLVFGASDLVAALWLNEMRAFPGALIGRLASYLVLWLLVVEIPLIARTMFERFAGSDDAARRRRLVAITLTAVVTGVLAYIWGEGARQLIGAVVFLSNLTPPQGVFTQLYYTDIALGFVLGVATAGIFAVRYLGPLAHVGRPEPDAGPSAGRRALSTKVLGLGIAMLLLVGYIDQPIDAVILATGLILSRPAATMLLRLSRLAPLLVRVPWPLRLVAGFALSFGAATAYLQAMGISQVSRFGYMVIAIAVSIVIIEVLLAADDVVEAEDISRGRSVAEGIAIGSLLLLAFPAIAAAHSGHQEATAVAGAATAGAAAGVAMSRRRRQGQKPEQIPRPSPLVPGFNQKRKPPAQPPEAPKQPDKEPPPPAPQQKDYPWWDPRGYF